MSIVVAVGPAHADAPVLVNSSGNNWLESLTISNEDTSKNTMRMTFLVKHDPGVTVSNVRVDDDYNGTDNTATAGTRTITTQDLPAPSNYTRVTTSFSPSTSNVGFSCNAFGAST